MNLYPSPVTAAILIIEDDVSIRELVKLSFAAANFDVDISGTIAEARANLACKKYDLLIVDVHLPDGNGIEFARELLRTSNAGIIIMTGGGDEIDRIIGLELGADDYINKPFHQRELVARARAVLRRITHPNTQGEPLPSEVRSSDIQFHGYSLSKTARTLTDPNGIDVELTTMEFDVLAVLVENKNVVLDRNAIFKSAGFRGSDPGRVIDGLVSRLRRKLVKTEGPSVYIRTVHGRGYTLAD